VTEAKKSPSVRGSSAGWSGLYKVAIVGASSLKGKEVAEVLEERRFPASDIALLDDDSSQGQLESVGDEATFIQNVTRTSFEHTDIVFFTGDADFTRKHWAAAKAAGCAIVDVSYALESEPGIGIRSPWLDREMEAQVVPSTVDLNTTSIVAAHPAAVMLALLLYRVQRTGALRNATVTYFEPVSEQGKRGMDELHRQSLNLLSFQEMPKEIFDVQVAFNMLPRFGEEAQASLDDSAGRIARHFKAITHSRLDMPAMQVLHVPAFHGQTAAIYLELDRKVSATDFALAVQGEHVQIVPTQDDAPSNVTASGQDEILVSLRNDSTREKGIWLWAAADNLKLAAVTAAECAVALAATRPAGKIQ
jgi:aspartate-semialdehyde dehydrogenase